MTAMPPLRDILNNTPANAVDVDFNFNTIESHVGSELINRDGSVAMTGPLTLAAAPTAPMHAATKAYVDGNVVPIGVIWEFAGNVAPAGWAFCDGASKSTTDPAYAALFAVIGYRHGGSGANFNLPDRRARVAVGFLAADGLFGTLGAKGGSRDAVVPNHTHDIAHTHAGVGTTAADTNHRHTIDHDHPNIGTSLAGNHDHTVLATGEGIWYYGGGGTLGMDTSGTGHSGAPSNLTGAGAVTSRAPDHQHTLDMPYFSGVSGYQSDQFSNYTHSHTTNPISLASTPSTNPNNGVVPTNANYPPYEVVNFIIRIG